MNAAVAVIAASTPITALALCLVAARIGVLSVSVRKPARPRPPKEPTP